MLKQRDLNEILQWIMQMKNIQRRDIMLYWCGLASTICFSFGKKALSTLLSLLLLFQSTVLQAQQLSADQNAAAANQPRVDAAGNGVPLVNIVTPNGAGLSHNKYSDFNVGNPGLILNNSNQDLQRSQLGGLVPGNANLKYSGPATVILNEVTGANRSLLQGATEVHGRAADVVIANPNGLTCNGCGFINTPRVVLSTGTPELDSNGALANLHIERGDVTIGANGADLSNSAIFDIVSRRISVNGPINTNGDINLVAGHNAFAYASGAVTSLGDDGNEPAIAIDSSLLGGMYAGRIKIISTDKGSGVNMQGNMAANAGTMSLSADGKLTLGKTYAKKSIQAKSTSQSIQVTSTLFSDEAIVLEGKSAIQVSDNGLVGSSGDVSLGAKDITLGTRALVAAGMNSDGTQTSHGNLTLQAESLEAGNGQLASGRLLSIAAGTVDLSRSKDTGENTFRSLGTIIIDARHITASNGRATANGNLNITSSDNLVLEDGRFISGEQLLVKAASLTASASIIALRDLTLETTSGDLIQTSDASGNDAVNIRSAANLNNSGHILSAGESHLNVSGDVTNTASGIISANGASDLTANGKLSNSGEISSRDQMRLTVIGDLTNGGKLLATKNLELNAGSNLSNQQNSVAQGASVTLTAGSFDNNGILTATNGLLSASVAGTINNAGELSAQGDLALTTSAGLTNTGKLVSLGAMTLSGGANAALGAFSNSATGVVNGTTGLTFSAGYLDNAGTIGSGSGTLSGSLTGNLINRGLIYGAGASALTVGDTLTNGGEISSRDVLRFTVARNLSNAGKLLTAKDLSLSAGNFTNQQNAAVQGATITLNASSLDNEGLLSAANGALSASVTGSAKNAGELSATGDVTLATSVNLTNSGKLVSLGTMTLSGINNTALGTFTNSVDGLVNGTIGLTFNASSLNNAGSIGSGRGNLLASLSGNLDNSGLLYANGSAIFRLDGAFSNNGGDVIAEQGLAVRGLTRTQAGDLTNTSGLIQSSTGDVSLKARSILNARSSGVSFTTQSTVGTATENIDVDDHTTNVKTTTTTTTRDTANIKGVAAQIRTGGNLLIDTDTLTNTYSLISAVRDITIKASLVTNEGRDLVETVNQDIQNNYSRRSYRGFPCFCHRWTKWTTTDHSISTQTYDSIYGTIQAGGSLIANVSGYLNNDAVRGGAGQIGLSSGKSIGVEPVNGAVGGSAVGVASVAGPTSSQSVSQQDFTASLTGLIGRKATFEAAAANAPYVVETRNQFIDPSKFLSSSYFLSRIGGYNPETSLKQLGDAYFEYRLIQNQIFTQTGSATLGSETDPIKLVASLYDNALAAKDTLGLAAGVALSADQVSKLTQNIVWMEKQTVNGQDVLVPRLYLAKTTTDNLNIASAQIKGTSVQLAAAGMTNSGAILSDTALSIASSGAFANNGGNLFAKNDIVINAADAFTNTSGRISGNNITIQAASIGSDTAATRDIFSNGFGDRQQQTARIQAGGDLLLTSSGTLSAVGGQLSAGKALTLQAGSSVHLSALALETSRDDRFSAGFDRASATTNTLTSLSAGGNLTINAGQDIVLAGANASVGGGAALKAGGNATIAAVADETSTALSLKTRGGGLFGSSRQQASSATSTTARASSISAQNGLSIIAGQDVTLSGSTLTASGRQNAANLAVSAGRDLMISSVVDTSAKASSSSSRGFLSRKSQSNQSYDETNIASALKASGNINLSAGQDAAISGSNLTADKAVSITASNVSIIGAQESHSSQSASAKSGLFVGSGGGFISLYGSKKNTGAQATTNNVASNVRAGTDATLRATGTDVNILGSNLSAGNDIALSAKRDVNITPGAETANASSESKRSGFGINLSSTSSGVSIGLGLKKTTDTTQQSANTNATSTITAGRDLSISAGRDINLQATKASSERDLSLDAVRDVNLLAATDSSNYAHMHEELFAGVSLNVQSSLIRAGQGLADAGSTLGGSNSPYGLAPTALAAKRAYEAVEAARAVDPKTGKRNSPGSASITAGFIYEKTKQTVATTTPVVTELRSGGSTSIVAQEGSITSNGAQIVAGYDAKGQLSKDADGGNILLSAGKDINLSSVQSTSTAQSTTSSASAGIGLDLGTGTPVGNAAFGNGKINNTASGQTNTHVSGTGIVALNSGRDTTLKGAVVSGTSVIANVGHDLNIESQQDTATYRENNTSAGGGFGPSGASASANKGNIKGDYANVSEQSGIIAGSGGYHIAVGNGVDLKGGVITSTAPSDKNSLSADHLTYSDLDNTSKSSTSSMGVGIGTGKDGKLGLPTPIIGQPAKEDDHGKALATLSPGNLTLAHQTQNLASLNTDASKANSQVSPLDIEKLKAKQLSAAALSQLLSEGVGDLSVKLGFAEGSAEKTALHAAVGALVSQLAGGNVGTGALSGAASELANGVLQDVLKANPNLSEADKAAITQWVATAVGAAVGGQAGAAAALDNVNHNFLTHKQKDELAAELKACEGQADASACKAEVSKRYIDLDFVQESKLDACRTTDCLKAVLGDLYGDSQFAYNDVMALQELGVSEVLAQRLLAYQVQERWITGDASPFEQRIADVAAGVGYCEANGDADGCFAKGQALKYTSEAVNELVYLMLGASKANKSTDVENPVGSAGKGDNPSAANAALFEKQRAAYAAQEIKEAKPVGSALKDDALHRAASYVIDQIPENGRLFTIKGNDGQSYNLTQMTGTVNGASGIFEWIVNSKGELTHQRFIPEGKITGKPNQIPSKLPK
jgi:filamentous hemagglutinin